MPKFEPLPMVRPWPVPVILVVLTVRVADESAARVEPVVRIKPPVIVPLPALLSAVPPSNVTGLLTV